MIKPVKKEDDPPIAGGVIVIVRRVESSLQVPCTTCFIVAVPVANVVTSPVDEIVAIVAGLMLQESLINGPEE